MTRADVERFFEQDLLAHPLPGSILLVLDNAAHPQGWQHRGLWHRGGLSVLYLPPITGHEPDRDGGRALSSAGKRGAAG